VERGSELLDDPAWTIRQVVPQKSIGVPTDSLSREISVVVATDVGDLRMPPAAVDLDDDPGVYVGSVYAAALALGRRMRELEHRSREATLAEHAQHQGLRPTLWRHIAGLTRLEDPAHELRSLTPSTRDVVEG